MYRSQPPWQNKLRVRRCVRTSPHSDHSAMQLRDTPNSYGWISIGLHWITAFGIFALLFAGSSIGGEISSTALRLHTTVALCLYAVFWWRIVRRIRQGHPTFAGPARPISHALASFVH